MSIHSMTIFREIKRFLFPAHNQFFIVGAAEIQYEHRLFHEPNLFPNQTVLPNQTEPKKSSLRLGKSLKVIKVLFL
jgi:hypothetical protein